MKTKTILKHILLICLMCCIQNPAYASQETRKLEIEIEGDGQVILNQQTINEKNPLSIDLPYDVPVELEITEKQDKLEEIYINDEKKAIQSMRYTLDMKQDYRVRIVMKKQESIIVTGIDYYKYQIKNTGSWKCGLYEINHGIQGFCAEARMADFKLNQTLESPQPVTNPMIRKILYYGYNGPEDMLTEKYGKDGAICMTSEMLSKANTGITISELLGNKGWQNVIRPLYESIEKKPDPYNLGYNAYICKNKEYGNNFMGNYVKRQDLFYGIMETPHYAHIQILKKSSQPELTQDNTSYSLKDAWYGVYATRKDAENEKNELEVFKTNEEGTSQKIQLLPGQYYIKEIKAPQGYLLSKEIYEADFKADQTYLLQDQIFEDAPKIPDIDILLEKKDSITKKPLKDVLFKVTYYKTSQSEPYRSWTFKTDEKGQIRFQKEYQTSNEPLELAYGTLKIEEIQTIPGYLLHSETITKDLSETYETPIILNDPIQFKLRKIQKGTDIPITDIEFLHTMPDQKTQTIQTDEKGEFHFQHLQPGKHTIQETKTKNGYELNPETFEFTVQKDGSISIPELVIENEVSPFTLEVYKKNTFGFSLDKAQFTLYEDKECTKKIETKETIDGKAVFKNLKDKTIYYLKETKAPEGYELKNNIYEIKTESIPEQNLFTVFLDQKKSEQDSKTRIAKMEVYNDSAKVLPYTGSHTTLIFAGFGIVILLISILKGRKHEK